MRNKQWRKARKLSDELLAFITAASASGTLEDVRRRVQSCFLVFLQGRLSCRLARLKPSARPTPNP